MKRFFLIIFIVVIISIIVYFMFIKDNKQKRLSINTADTTLSTPITTNGSGTIVSVDTEEIHSKRCQCMNDEEVVKQLEKYKEASFFKKGSERTKLLQMCDCIPESMLH